MWAIALSKLRIEYFEWFTAMPIDVRNAIDIIDDSEIKRRLRLRFWRVLWNTIEFLMICFAPQLLTIQLVRNRCLSKWIKSKQVSLIDWLEKLIKVKMASNYRSLHLLYVIADAVSVYCKRREASRMEWTFYFDFYVLVCFGSYPVP